MNDQQIIGYRELSREEIALMNEGKALAEQVGAFIDKLQGDLRLDQRCIATAKTNLQQGFMWATRGITKPTSF